MESIIGLNKKQYELVVAENYLCVPAVLETLLKSEGHRDIDKYRIANYLGVVLPPSVHYPQVINCTFSAASNLQGIKICRDTLNCFFSAFDLPLHEEYLNVRMIGHDLFSEYIFDILSSGKHIICGYEYFSLHGLSGKYVGHVSMIVNLNLRSERIALLNPGPKEPGFEIVSSYMLYRAISIAKDGLWVIS